MGSSPSVTEDPPCRGAGACYSAEVQNSPFGVWRGGCQSVAKRRILGSPCKCDFARFHPDFKGENSGGSQAPPTALPLSINHMRGLAARLLFRVPPCREGTIHAQISMPSSGLEPKSYGSVITPHRRHDCLFNNSY
ncbi:hypothetical protein TNCV_1544821 [Trichonephila clavipes]|nr:hypothetical protein TNCV_1544821 [Trichonephila clavipes]